MKSDCLRRCHHLPAIGSPYPTVCAFVSGSRPVCLNGCLEHTFPVALLPCMHIPSTVSIFFLVICLVFVDPPPPVGSLTVSGPQGLRASTTPRLAPASFLVARRTTASIVSGHCRSSRLWASDSHLLLIQLPATRSEPIPWVLQCLGCVALPNC
jgi:hypothetical protein